MRPLTAGDADWTPEFLDTFQNESLNALAERMVPGSTNAKVNRFIDLLLTVDTQENQKKFVASLGAFEAESRSRITPRRSASPAPLRASRRITAARSTWPGEGSSGRGTFTRSGVSSAGAGATSTSSWHRQVDRAGTLCLSGRA